MCVSLQSECEKCVVHQADTLPCKRRETVLQSMPSDREDYTKFCLVKRKRIVRGGMICVCTCACGIGRAAMCVDSLKSMALLAKKREGRREPVVVNLAESLRFFFIFKEV